ncbi:MAG: methylmalonyl Co-A mutase-associated GTPase MeaB [Rubrobacteraceae bacterium]
MQKVFVAGGELAERLLGGDRRALARVISKIEREDPETAGIISEIYPHTGGALTVGFTGPPGVGKSSVISNLVRLYREEDKKVGIVSVDPSSPFSKGAILGDRIRLSDHFLDTGVFIRSMGSRGHLGGLAGGSRLAALAMEAAGMDVVIFETVGVGQGEVEVASAADTVVLCLQPGAGDSVQALKAGVMEVADIFCINKSDHPQAPGAASEVRSILEIGHELDPEAPMPPILMTRGDTGEGIEELKSAIEEHRQGLRESGTLKKRRREALREFVVSWATNRLEKEMQERLGREDTELMEKVYNRELDPISASEEIFREEVADGSPGYRDAQKY